MPELAPVMPAVVPEVAPAQGYGGRGRIARQLELWVPLAFFAFVVFSCVLAPVIFSMPNPSQGNLAQPFLPAFSPGHLLGTDQLGNDVLSRLLYGGRVSLAVGFGSTAIGLAVGGALGIIGAYQGGIVDAVIGRCLDILLAFPSLVLAMTVVAYLGPTILNVIWAIAFFSTPAFARLARAQAQRLVGQDFVTAAKLGGASDLRVMGRHIAPNVLSQLLTYSFLYVSLAIIIEASLSFLGLGVQPPTPTWGNMIEVGEQNIYNAPGLLLIPSIALFLTVLALNLLGDAIRARWAE